MLWGVSLCGHNISTTLMYIKGLVQHALLSNSLDYRLSAFSVLPPHISIWLCVFCVGPTPPGAFSKARHCCDIGSCGKQYITTLAFHLRLWLCVMSICHCLLTGSCRVDTVCERPPTSTAAIPQAAMLLQPHTCLHNPGTIFMEPKWKAVFVLYVR